MMKLLGIEAEFKKMFEKIETTVKENNQKTVNNLLNELKEATPVDTGFAKAQWEMNYENDNFVLNNTAPYIEDLNQGHSQQAPSHFIENIAINYGKPFGTIVEIRQE